jgi:hypothetical protein
MECLVKGLKCVKHAIYGLAKFYLGPDGHLGSDGIPCTYARQVLYLKNC